MKKKKRKIPACSMGAKTDLSGMGDSLGGVLSLINGIGGSSTATNQQEVVAQSLADVGQGASTGMKVGSMFGPVGSAVGAVGGALVGAIGKKGKIEETEGFTQDNNYTLGTGFRAFGNKRLKRKQNKDKLNVQGNRIAVANTEELRSDWDEENGGDVYTFEYGGGMMESMAYVDDGEMIQTPDGSINKVPENNSPTDSNLTSLPGGSKILSDTLKIPGTNKTFAQTADKMMTKKKSLGSDKYAENSRKLNEQNNNMIHDQLFELQEYIKAQRGIKPKTKAFVQGGLTGLKDLSDTLGLKAGKTISTTLPMAGFSYDNEPSNTTLPVKEHIVNTPQKKGLGLTGLGSLATDVMSLAPTVSNLFSGKAESVAPIQNPYADRIQRTMRKRSYDIEPAKQAIIQNRAISDYNANQMNTGTGANMAYRLQSAIGADKATSELYNQASNIQNQYDADYANTLNSLGQQYVGAVGSAQDINMRSKAANRNIQRAGISQLSDFAQNKQLMSNQKNRDMAMMDMYQPFLEAGFTQDQIQRMLKNFVK